MGSEMCIRDRIRIELPAPGEPALRVAVDEEDRATSRIARFDGMQANASAASDVVMLHSSLPLPDSSGRAGSAGQCSPWTGNRFFWVKRRPFRMSLVNASSSDRGQPAAPRRHSVKDAPTYLVQQIPPDHMRWTLIPPSRTLRLPRLYGLRVSMRF